MRRTRPPWRALHPVLLTEVPDAAGRVGVPGGADDRDALLQRVHGLAGRQARRAHGDDGVPVVAGAEGELEAAVAENVQAGGGLGEHGGRPERQRVHAPVAIVCITNNWGCEGK